MICVNCGEEFPRGERRGDSIHRYKGHYCQDCHDHLVEHGELPEP